jgi:hypothetical protein
LAVLAVGLSTAVYGSGARAEFDLNWTADNANPVFSGTDAIHGGTDEGGTTVLTDQTPFIYERVFDPVSGLPYYHMIIGDPAQGFAQEVYIRVGVNGQFPGPFPADAIDPVTNVNTGIGSEGSASAGFGQNGEGQAIDPLGPNRLLPVLTSTGNGSGNPNFVQMREVLNDGEISIEFLKDKYLEKPSITSNITAADFTTTFAIDSTGLTYDDASTAAVVTNTAQILDPGIPAGAAQFDVTAGAQDSTVTAGQYTYSIGPFTRGSGGTYTYPNDGGFNLDLNWSDYFDPTEANPWSYTQNRPTP